MNIHEIKYKNIGHKRIHNVMTHGGNGAQR